MWTLCKELKGTQSFSEQDYFPYREIMGKTAGFWINPRRLLSNIALGRKARHIPPST
jgi:hypothetical protein